MGKICSSTILAAVAALSLAALAGCRADPGSRVSSEMDRSVSSAPPHSQEAPSHEAAKDEAPSPDAAPSATPASGSATDTRPLIVCFGDSLTAGYGADEGQSYPDFLQRDLDRDGYHYRVVNEGVSGNTTKDGVDRLPGVLRMKPELVVVEFGGNDGLRGLKVGSTRSNLDTMIAGLRKNGVRIVIAGMTLPPDYGPDYINAFTANYAALGRKYDAPVLPFLLKDVYGVDGMMQADNIHATDRGNEIVARNVLAEVEPLLKRQR